MQRAWFKAGEKYNRDVKKRRVKKYSKLQFYGAFTYDEKGPCHVYAKETAEQKKAAAEAIKKENLDRQEQRERLIPQARAALQELREAEANLRKWPWSKKMAYKCNDRVRGGIDGYRHREEVLKPLI